MTRYLPIIIVGISACLAIAYFMADHYGLDPFSSDMNLYWAVIVITGVYVSVRIAGLLEKRRNRGQAPEDLRPRTWKKRDPDSKSIQSRMEARRERVRRAQERQAAAGKPPADTGEGED